MALRHAHPGEAIDVAPLGSRLAEGATHALLKTTSLELIRVVLRAGESQPRHRVHGETTIHCLEGEVVVSSDSGECRLGAGQLLLLGGGNAHGVEALADSSLLVTIHIPPGQPGSGSATG